MLPYISQIVEEASLFRLPYLDYNFMIANLVRLNLAVLKILLKSQEIPVVEYHVSKLIAIHSPIQLIPPRILLLYNLWTATSKFAYSFTQGKPLICSCMIKYL